MLIPYKKDYEKTAMGLLSYLTDYKNLKNLKDEMDLLNGDNEFGLYLYRNEYNNIVGVVGTQETEHFIIVRYLSLAPGFRDEENQRKLLNELADAHAKKRVTAIPECTYLLKLLH